MKFPMLQMTSQYAKISIEQQPSVMNIKQPKANLQIEQPSAKIRIHTTKGKLTIDQSQAWEETNIKSPLKWARMFARDGIEAAKSGTARRAEQGAELLNIHLDQHIIREQAIRNGASPMRTPIITYIPTPFSVKFSYQPADVQIDAETHQVRIQPTVNQPDIQVKRGGVDISMKQYASLHIEMIPSKINQTM